MTAAHPFSTRRGRKLRAAKLQSEPRCQPCLRKGKLSVAVEVHHIKPLKSGGDPWDWDNLQSICRACHVGESGGKPKGCDVNGYPVAWK